MSALEIVTLSLSLILGLSMAQMLSSVALSIRSRHESRFHWVPVAWAAAIFSYHVQFWFALIYVDRMIVSWSWDWFGPILIMAVLLFLSGALVLPSAGRPLPTDLIADFEEHGRLALVPVSVYGLLWIPLNVRLGDGWLSATNVLTLVVVALAGVAYFSRDRRVRGAATLAYLAVSVWGVVWIWSPGAAS
jgi:hypothetical protein